VSRRKLRRRCDYETSTSAKRPDTRTSALLSLFSATARLLRWRKQTTVFRSSSLLCLPSVQGAGDAQVAAWVGVSIKRVPKRCQDLVHVRHRRLKRLHPAGAQAVLLPRHWSEGRKRGRARPGPEATPTFPTIIFADDLPASVLDTTFAQASVRSLKLLAALREKCTELFG
jgi:hypothetical protein